MPHLFLIARRVRYRGSEPDAHLVGELPADLGE